MIHFDEIYRCPMTISFKLCHGVLPSEIVRLGKSGKSFSASEKSKSSLCGAYSKSIERSTRYRSNQLKFY